MNRVDLGISAFSGILAASAAVTILALLVIRRWSDQEALCRAKEQAQAHLLECRLFLDEPRQIFRSQRALIADNLRIFRLLLRPLLILAIPTALLMWQLDALYGRAPLRIGQAAVISAASRLESLTAPGGLAVEAGPVYIRTSNETSWRIRPALALSGTLRAGTLAARVVAGERIAYLPERLFGRPSIDVTYPQATVFGLSWVFWFLLLTSIFGLFLRGRFGVRI
jgi:hypothetical protein